MFVVNVICTQVIYFETVIMLHILLKCNNYVFDVVVSTCYMIITPDITILHLYIELVNV